jgi:hypothetical protein
MPKLNVTISRSEIWDSVIYLLAPKPNKILALIYFDDPCGDLNDRSLRDFVINIRFRLASQGEPRHIEFYVAENHCSNGARSELKYRRLQQKSRYKYSLSWPALLPDALKIAASAVQAEGAYPVSKRLREAGQ